MQPEKLSPTDGDQVNHVADFARVQLERYEHYHAHKESMAYAGLALFAAAAGAILIADKWPPTVWGVYRTIIATFAVTAFWFVVLTYLRFQLHRRRWAALRIAGCEHVLAKWATGDLKPDSRLNAARRAAIDKVPRWRTFLDFVWPQKVAVPAVKMSKDDPPVYPGILLDEWVEQEKTGTDALQHERLIVVSGWGLFLAVILRTICGAGS
jgi:hypothetical protein